MDNNSSFYKFHIFMCIHPVENPLCCVQRGSKDLFLYFRRKVVDLGIWNDVAVTHTGCMGRCMSGPALVIYPDNVWYSPKTKDDIDEIFRRHIQKGQIVARLLMPNIEPELIGYVGTAQ